ncbi:hypothetical protein ACFQVC_17920 [Streptomyces monticola]|uniref:Uncharacterized protein n=1 Tax=Streptomyces monticola TaxID=2666263 RepID=A0ABW2JKD4_9ACTN
MAHNPHAPQGPEGQHDPAGSTQMFRAFVDEGGRPEVSGSAAESGKSGKKTLWITLAVVLVVAFAILSMPNRPWTIW